MDKSIYTFLQKPGIKKKQRKKNLKSLSQKEKKSSQIKSYFTIKLLIIFFFIISSFFLIKIKKNVNISVENSKNFNYEKEYSSYEREYKNSDPNCEALDPIRIFKLRIDKGPIVICSGEKTKHICYQNPNDHFNDIFDHRDGVICTMENIVLDPSHSRQSGLSYKDGPVDGSHLGLPLLDKGFINAECSLNKTSSFNYDNLYSTYFNSWVYDYDIKNEREELEELAPGKVVFFLSRNQDSPNIFYGHSDIINSLSMIYLFNLDPKDIQVVFLESIEIPYSKDGPKDDETPNDHIYDIFQRMISKGGEPIYIKNLKKKYKISKAIHVPINWDSPLSIEHDFPKCDFSVKTYKLYNDFMDKYMGLKPFEDKWINDNEFLYYPESVLKSHESGNKFDKIVTIQWRRVWPKKRRGQGRIMNNGPQMADKLASLLPKNILVRLINNAKLKMEDQISLVRNTDYFVGMHGCGLSLMMFMPHNSIYHEVQQRQIRSQLCVMSALSGHRTFVDVLKNNITTVEGNEVITFDEDEFARKVLEHMKESNFI